QDPDRVEGAPGPVGPPGHVYSVPVLDDAVTCKWHPGGRPDRVARRRVRHMKLVTDVWVLMGRKVREALRLSTWVIKPAGPDRPQGREPGRSRTGTLVALLLLSGVFLPLSPAPQWLRVLAHVNPLYYAVEASRDLVVGTIGSATVGRGFLVMGGLAVLAIAWATRVYRKAVA